MTFTNNSPFKLTEQKISLDEDHAEDLYRDVINELVRELISKDFRDMQLVTRAQACGILNCDAKTLEKIGNIPHLSLGKRKLYRLSDIKDYVSQNLV